MTVPPYCGVPSLSHQFPVVAVVVGVVVLVLVMVDVVFVVDVVDVFDVFIDVEVVVDVAQDATSIAAAIKKLKPNQITLFFNSNSYLTPNLICYKYILVLICIFVQVIKGLVNADFKTRMIKRSQSIRENREIYLSKTPPLLFT